MARRFLSAFVSRCWCRGATELGISQYPDRNLPSKLLLASIEHELTRPQTLSLFQSAFPRIIAPNVPSFIRLAILNLQSLLPLFTAFYLSTTDDTPEPPSPTSDSGTGMTDPKIDITDLASAIFDYLTPTVRTKSAVGVLMEGQDESARATEVLENLVRVVQEFTQITKENASCLLLFIGVVLIRWCRPKSGWKTPMRSLSTRTKKLKSTAQEHLVMISLA